MPKTATARQYEATARHHEKMERAFRAVGKDADADAARDAATLSDIAALRAYDAETDRLATKAASHCGPGFAAGIRTQRAEKRPTEATR